MAALRLVVPGNVIHRSGGNLYNSRLADALGGAGADVEIRRADGDWPDAGSRARERLTILLQGPGPVLVDGLIASGAPDEIRAAVLAGRRVWVLVHMPVLDGEGLERRALEAATGVVCTSSDSAERLRTLYGLERIGVALPGTAAAAVATGSRPPRIVSVAALLPNKNQDLLVRALSSVRDAEWTAELVGSTTADPGYVRTVRATLADHGLEGRVRLTGELAGEELERHWAAADLSVLVSGTETFGLAVTESLARGIPVLVRGGTGAVEALGAGGGPALPGAAVELDEHPAPLAAVLRRWLEEEELRRSWREAALAARTRLPGWDATARTVLELLS